MRIHHLNCGTHCPIGGALFDGRSRGPLADLCTHCLLIETGGDLVLVDTGYGLADVRRNPRRLARTWPLVLNPQLREQDTAIHQIEALGFGARDVRHIVLTHLDFDHAGGIADFPHARVHLMAIERHAADHRRRSFVDRQRYRPAEWSAVSDWRTYGADGDGWFGFDAVRALDGLPPEILMVPLHGHTHGHAGVAVRTGSRWLLHAGDAYLHEGELDLFHRQMPLGLAVYERIMSSDPVATKRNLARLRALKRAHQHEVRIFCSHDSSELAELKGGSYASQHATMATTLTG